MPTKKEEIKKPTTAKKATPKTTTAKKVAPKTTAKKVMPKTTTAKKVAPKTTAKKAMPKTPTAKKVAPKTTAKKVAPKTTTTTKKAAPKTTPIKEKKVEQKKDAVEEAMNKVEDIMDTKDTTNKYKEEDIKNSIALSVLSYIGILCLIPYFLGDNSKFTMFNAKQGVNLFVLEVLVFLVLGFINLLTPWWISRAIYYVACILFVLLSLAGIINVLNGKAKELPYIGKIKFIK